MPAVMAVTTNNCSIHSTIASFNTVTVLYALALSRPYLELEVDQPKKDSLP